MEDTDFTNDVTGEAWRKEFDKLLLSRKLERAATIIGQASSNPFEENVKAAYGAINDYISFIPLGTNENAKKSRTDMLAKLDKIRDILYGDKSDINVLQKIADMNLGLQYIRQGPYSVPILTQLPLLVCELRSILLEADDFAVSHGLRIVLAEKKTKGMKKINEEEGFDD